jgi:DNA-binding MarR family transcriptional regulator
MLVEVVESLVESEDSYNFIKQRYTMKRRPFESKTIDMTTGEVKSITTVTVDRLKERFIMCRTTDTLAWVKEFTGKELQMLMVLNHMENLQTQTVTLTPLTRKEIQEFFDIGKSTLSGMLTQMEEKRFLLKLSNNDLLLNPGFFYKGESKDVLKRIQEFNKVYDERRGNPEIRTESDENTELSTEKERRELEKEYKQSKAV